MRVFSAPGAATRAVRLFAGWVVLTMAAHAHDAGLSSAQVEVGPEAIVITTGFAPADVQQLLATGERPDEVGTDFDFDAAHSRLLALAPLLWELRGRDSTLTPRDGDVQLVANDNISFRVAFPRAAAGEKLILRAPKLVELPQGHRQFVIISDERGSTLTKKLLSARDSQIEVSLPAIPGSGGDDVANAGQPSAFWGFLKLGVAHIWTGYDHLLFLFALLIVCRTFRSIVAIVSCFTLAHSVTLALATLDVVKLSPRVVEPAIAASIVFVGVENLWRRGEEPPGRWALTFAFGLVHGFGFASVLRDLGVGQGRGGALMPLFTFNLGVEVGQVAIAAVVLPLVWQLRKYAGFVRWGVPVFSALTALAGLYWFLQRTVLA